MTKKILFFALTFGLSLIHLHCGGDGEVKPPTPQLLESPATFPEGTPPSSSAPSNEQSPLPQNPDQSFLSDQQKTLSEQQLASARFLERSWVLQRIEVSNLAKEVLTSDLMHSQHPSFGKTEAHRLRFVNSLNFLHQVFRGNQLTENNQLLESVWQALQQNALVMEFKFLPQNPESFVFKIQNTELQWEVPLEKWHFLSSGTLRKEIVVSDQQKFSILNFNQYDFDSYFWNRPSEWVELKNQNMEVLRISLPFCLDSNMKDCNTTLFLHPTSFTEKVELNLMKSKWNLIKPEWNQEIGSHLKTLDDEEIKKDLMLFSQKKMIENLFNTISFLIESFNNSFDEIIDLNKRKELIVNGLHKKYKKEASFIVSDNSKLDVMLESLNDLHKQCNKESVKLNTILVFLEKYKSKIESEKMSVGAGLIGSSMVTMLKIENLTLLEYLFWERNKELAFYVKNIQSHCETLDLQIKNLHKEEEKRIAFEEQETKGQEELRVEAARQVLLAAEDREKKKKQEQELVQKALEAFLKQLEIVKEIIKKYEEEASKNLSLNPSDFVSSVNSAFEELEGFFRSLSAGENREYESNNPSFRRCKSEVNDFLKITSKKILQSIDDQIKKIENKMQSDNSFLGEVRSFCEKDPYSLKDCGSRYLKLNNRNYSQETLRNLVKSLEEYSIENRQLLSPFKTLNPFIKEKIKQIKTTQEKLDSSKRDLSESLRPWWSIYENLLMADSLTKEAIDQKFNDLFLESFSPGSNITRFKQGLSEEEIKTLKEQSVQEIRDHLYKKHSKPLKRGERKQAF